MSEVENQKAGTPVEDQDGGDAAEEQTAGTPEASPDGGDAGNDEITRLRNQLRESMVWKEKAEEANRLRRELDEIRALQSQQPQTPQEPNGVLQAWLAREWYAAQNGDDEAAARLLVLQRQEAQMRQLSEELQFAQIPEAERERVRRGFNANRHRFADVRAYYEAEQGKSVAELRRELEEMRAKLEERRTDTRNGVVSTVTRPVPSREATQRREMTLQQFTKEFDGLMAQGKRDDAWKLSADFSSGKIARRR